MQGAADEPAQWRSHAGSAGRGIFRGPSRVASAPDAGAHLDDDRDSPARERDEFFWLDLEDPSPARSTRRRRCWISTRSRVEDTREFGQRPKVDVYEQPPAARLLLRAGQRRGDADAVEVHIYLSGGLRDDRQPDHVHRAGGSPRRARGDADPGRGLPRLPDPRHAHRRLLPGDRRASRSRVDALEAQVLLDAPARAAPASSTGCASTSRELQRARPRPARPLPQTSERDPVARRASSTARASTCATSATTSPRSPASCRARPMTSTRSPAPTSTRTPDRLNAVATRLTIDRHAVHRHDARHGLLRPELRLARQPHQPEGDFLVFGVGGLLVPIAIARHRPVGQAAGLVLTQRDSVADKIARLHPTEELFRPWPSTPAKSRTLDVEPGSSRRRWPPG